MMLGFLFRDLEYDCGTASTGVRKACKNCTCGLAQELEQEEHAAAKTAVKSACGSVSNRKRTLNFTSFVNCFI